MRFGFAVRGRLPLPPPPPPEGAAEAGAVPGRPSWAARGVCTIVSGCECWYIVDDAKAAAAAAGNATIVASG
jgi:hypothetical protein